MSLLLGLRILVGLGLVGPSLDLATRGGIEPQNLGVPMEDWAEWPSNY